MMPHRRHHKESRMQPRESLEQMADATAAKLVEAAAGFAFNVFRDEQFRALARFAQLSQEEHDRIFNELLVGALVLIMLVLEAPDLQIEDDQRAFLADISKRIPDAQVASFRALGGIEEKHLREWDMLIRMRYDEYCRDKHSVRAAAMQLEAAEKEIDMDAFESIQLSVPLNAVVIGTHRHICRSKTDGRDDLFKHLLRAHAEFFVHIRLLCHGRRLTWWMRARVAIKRFFRRLRRGRQP
jgi:hypothetical protein